MKKAASLLALVLAAAGLVACGGNNGTTTTTTSEAGGAASGGATTGGGGAGGATVEFKTDPGGQLAYTSESETAKAGNLTIEFDNPQSLVHDVAIEDSAGELVGKTDLVSDRSTSVILRDVKPGTYTFYCTVPGHREAGMEGTLTVK